MKLFLSIDQFSSACRFLRYTNFYAEVYIKNASFIIFYNGRCFYFFLRNTIKFDALGLLTIMHKVILSYCSRFKPNSVGQANEYSIQFRAKCNILQITLCNGWFFPPFAKNRFVSVLGYFLFCAQLYLEQWAHFRD